MENVPNKDKLEGWTKEEKFELLEALKEVGSFNIEHIKEFLCDKTGDKDKTGDEIKAALDYYRNKASALPTTRKKKNKINLPVVPLSRWAKFIIDSHGFDELQTETVTALRLIAEFEDKPPALCCEKIDFKNVYYMLADALEGKLLSNDTCIMALFDKCVVETALTSKALNKGSSCFKRILQSSCNPAISDLNTFPKPTEDNELATLRHLSSKKNYNPLNIPENYLKCSTPSM